MAIKAEKVVIKRGGTVIAKATGVTLEAVRQTIDTTSLSSEGYTEKLGGSKGWTASTDGLVLRTGDTFSNLFEELNDGTSAVQMIFEIGTGADSTIFIGDAILAGLSLSGSVGGVLTYSASFEGDKPLLKSNAVLLNNLQVNNITSTTALLSWEIN